MTDAISPFDRTTFRAEQATTPNRNRKRWQFWKPRHIVITEYRRVR